MQDIHVFTDNLRQQRVHTFKLSHGSYLGFVLCAIGGCASLPLAQTGRHSCKGSLQQDVRNTTHKALLFHTLVQMSVQNLLLLLHLLQLPAHSLQLLLQLIWYVQQRLIQQLQL